MSRPSNDYADAFINQPGPWGYSVNDLLAMQAAMNTSFSNTGFQRALQDRCFAPPGKFCPKFPESTKADFVCPQMTSPQNWLSYPAPKKFLSNSSSYQ